MKTFLTLAILASIAATPAMAETFTRDGTTYNYTLKSLGQATLISGTIVDTGESFSLKVKSGRVVGQVGSRPVNFRAEEAQAAAQGGTVLAAK
jgi:hypothetical protein